MSTKISNIFSYFAWTWWGSVSLMPLMSTNLKSGSSLSSAACLRYPSHFHHCGCLASSRYTRDVHAAVRVCVCVCASGMTLNCLSVCLYMCMCVYTNSYSPVLLHSFPSTKERILANSFSLQGRTPALLTHKVCSNGYGNAHYMVRGR